MKIITDNKQGNPDKTEFKSLSDLIRKHYEYIYITIPPVGTIILGCYATRYGPESLPSDRMIILFIDIIPILACLLIMTMKYRNFDTKTALLHYKRAGFYIPIIFLFCFIIAVLSGWINDDGAIGWFIAMAIPAAYIFSFITSIIGMGMRLVFKFVTRN